MKKNKIIYKEDNLKDVKDDLNSSEVFRSMVADAPFGMNLWSSDKVNIMCNAQILKLFNIESEEAFLDKFFDYSPQIQPNGISSKEMLNINLNEAFKTGKHVFNWMHVTPDGNKLPCEITLIKLNNSSNEDYVVGFIKDLRQNFSYDNYEVDYDYYFTDRLPKNVLLEEISDLTSEVFYSIDIRTGSIHHYGKLWFFGAEEQSEIFKEDIIEQGYIHEEDIIIYREMMDNIKADVLSKCDVRLLAGENNYRYFNITCKLITDNVGNPVFVFGKCVDIHEQRLIEERSQKDLLTDCYNKISAENIIADKLKSNNNSNYVFFIVDIDNFKAINDNLGHYFGDEVLRDISTGLKESFRDNDIVARIGGDEFIIFVENMSDLQIIFNKAEKILEIYQKTYSGQYKNYSISGSVGIALYPNDGKTYEELYQNADKALNQAKMQGKNRYVFYSSDFDIGTTRNITKIENANRMASSFFDYDLIAVVFNILYEKDGDSDAINLALSYLCQKYNADRSYIFETLDGGITLNNTFEYCKEGIRSEMDNLQNLPYALFADFLNKAHNDIIYSNNLRETLEQDRAFEIMDDQGILSFVHAQIKRCGQMTFFIGLDDCTKTRIWTVREINSLQYIGKLLSIILQAKHLRDELNEFQ